MSLNKPGNGFLLFALLFLLILPGKVTAQVYADGASFSRRVSYSNRDSIFVFPQQGALSALAPANRRPATFEWSRYDTITLGFGPVFASGGFDSISTVSGLQEGGYRVKVSQGGWDTLYHAFVCIHPGLEVSLTKTSQGRLPVVSFTCEYIDFRFTARTRAFRYFHPLADSLIVLPASLNFSWRTNNDASLPGNAQPHPQGGYYARSYDPPLKDTRYTLVARDQLGSEKQDEVEYILEESPHVKAEFKMSYDPEPDGEIYSSPIEVSFTNDSKTAAKYIWYFGRQPGDSLSVEIPEPQVYTRVRTYTVKLLAESPGYCVHEAVDSFTVSPSKLEAPNVFTPGGQNPYFKVYHVSIQQFRIQIYSRWGRKVYEFEGNNLHEWEGWDGHIGTKVAATGVYYFVIEALGWDENPTVEYKDGVYKGFFHLYGSRDAD
jgi:hypothetical protein